MRKVKTRTRLLAEAIVDDLFVNGQGQQASRLVLTADAPFRMDLGGWGRGAACDVIERALVKGGIE